MQNQLDKRILEGEKMRQQEREERRKAVEAVEKQVMTMRWTFVMCGNQMAREFKKVFVLVTI